MGKFLQLLAVGPFLSWILLAADSQRLLESVGPPPLPNASPRPAYDGPYVEMATNNLDSLPAVHCGTLFTRTNTYWLAGNTMAVGHASLVFAGVTNQIPLYQQGGRVRVGQVVRFVVEGHVYEFPLHNWQQVGTVHRLFYLEGNKQVVFTNTLTVIPSPTRK